MDNNGNLIINFRPFVFKQEILVYVDGACVKQDYVTVNEIVDKVEAYCKEYNIPRVNLCGNRHYVSKFAEKLMIRFERVNRIVEISQHN